ncbi:MAG: hypothetical protein JKY56_13845, partial [Kofleriaceae bacterium]|nr:hypothetical protein [Kofleriaceae bacterium]
LAKRTNESDYLYIISGLGCSSRVGHRGGKQLLSLADACDAGAGIHEIVHAIGLIHEHARPKRDDFIRVEWSNVVGGENGSFAKGNLALIQGAPTYSDYDPYSVMHYKSRFGGNYLVDANKPWFTSKIAGVSESQFGSNTLSAGDIAGVAAMYQGFGGGTPTGNENTCAVATCGQYSLAEGECKALTTGTFKCTGGCLENTSSCGTSTGTGTGTSDEFTCQDGSKVPASYRCDNWADCLDQSDEANCGVAPGTGLGTCQAAGLAGDCIDTNATTCAGQLHSNACSGLSNIRCCTASGAPTPPGNNSPEFTCANGEKIPLDYKCDSIQDCSDNSDESDATCPIPPGENAPSTDYGSCEVAGQPGWCIDTNATTCLGQLHSGACSGPSNIRCCT